MGVRVRLLVTVCAAVVTLGVVVVAEASAASYSVWSCRGPDGSAASTRAWSAGVDPAGTSDTCATGGSLRAQLLGTDGPAGTTRGFRFLLPAGSTISGYRIELAATTDQALIAADHQAGVASDSPAAPDAIDAGCPAAGCSFGTAASALDPGNLLTRATDSRGLVVAARCGASLGCLPVETSTPRAEVQLFRARVDVRDDGLPVVAAPTVAVDSASGLATITAEVTDGGGGVAAAALQIDGVELQRTATPTCREPYTEPAPCPAGETARFTIDAAALTAGAHDVRVRAVDAAGNVITGPPASLTAVARAAAGPGAPVGVTITLDRSRIDVGAAGSRIAGLVRTAGGTPVAGAQVLVRSQPFGVFRGPLKREPTLTTDGSGHFTVAASAPSRIVRFDVDDATQRASEPVEADLLEPLKVTAAVADRNLHNGSTMTLRAKLTGAGAGVRGKVVLVQSVIGGRWATVASLEADRSGVATWRYRFRGTTRPADYRFRARVERSGDIWPWPTTNSAPISVAVAP